MPLSLDLFNPYTFDEDTFNEISTLLVNTPQDIFTPVVFENLKTPASMPSSINLVPLTDIESVSMEIAIACRELVKEVEDRYELLSTVAAYYPPGGFIDWHTNENVEMYNAICTYSHTGNSFFEYINSDEEIIRINDTPGWTVKTTRWRKDYPVRHRAVSNDHRITFTFSHAKVKPVEEFITDFLKILI